MTPETKITKSPAEVKLIDFILTADVDGFIFINEIFNIREEILQERDHETKKNQSK